MADLVPEDQFDVELIVQCIRSSENPRTHTQALLLLATSAKLFPVNLLKVFHKLGGLMVGTPVFGFFKIRGFQFRPSHFVGTIFLQFLYSQKNRNECR